MIVFLNVLCMGWKKRICFVFCIRYNTMYNLPEKFARKYLFLFANKHDRHKVCKFNFNMKFWIILFQDVKGKVKSCRLQWFCMT